MGHNKARDNRKRKAKLTKRHACQRLRNWVQKLRVAACGVAWPREHFLKFFPVWKLTPKQVEFALKVEKHGKPASTSRVDEAS